jgi:predicted outer membrane repeat protein
MNPAWVWLPVSAGSAILAAMNTRQHHTHSPSQHKPRNFAGLIYISALVVCLLAQAPAVNAEGDRVMAGVVGTGTAASCTSAALQTALNGGGLVTFNCGPANATIITNTYVISANTEVDGGGKITLDGENLRQHFLVQSGVGLILRRITLTRGNSADGGSIYNQGATTVDSVSFTDNSATSDGGAIHNTASGALTVNNAIFSQNKAPLAVGYGGAIFSLGSITVTGGVFTQNEARYGGGLFVGGSAQADVNTSTFSTNKAQMFGGGVYMNNDSSAVTVTNSVFDKNTATSGAGLSRSGGTLTVQHASFTDNTAASQGGGMNVSALANTVRVANTTFSGNISADNKGGGIYNNGTLELVNVTLKGNTNGLFNFGAGESTQIRNSVLDNIPSLNCDSDGTAVTSGGRNFSNDGSCALGGPGDQSGAGLDPKLGPRQTSFTSYHLPLAGSPLIHAATNCTAFDQRYALRFEACDTGAAEYNGLLPQARLPIVIR